MYRRHSHRNRCPGCIDSVRHTPRHWPIRNCRCRRPRPDSDWHFPRPREGLVGPGHRRDNQRCPCLPHSIGARHRRCHGPIDNYRVQPEAPGSAVGWAAPGLHRDNRWYPSPPHSNRARRTHHHGPSGSCRGHLQAPDSGLGSDWATRSPHRCSRRCPCLLRSTGARHIHRHWHIDSCLARRWPPVAVVPLRAAPPPNDRHSRCNRTQPHSNRVRHIRHRWRNDSCHHTRSGWAAVGPAAPVEQAGRVAARRVDGRHNHYNRSRPGNNRAHRTHHHWRSGNCHHSHWAPAGGSGRAQARRALPPAHHNHYNRCLPHNNRGRHKHRHWRIDRCPSTGCPRGRVTMAAVDWGSHRAAMDPKCCNPHNPCPSRNSVARRRPRHWRTDRRHYTRPERLAQPTPAHGQAVRPPHR